MGWIKNLQMLLKVGVASLLFYLCGNLIFNWFMPFYNNYSVLIKGIFVLVSFVFCFLVYFGLSLVLRIDEASRTLIEIKNKISSPAK